MPDKTPWWEKQEAEQWGKDDTPSGASAEATEEKEPETPPEPLVEISEPPARGTPRFRRFACEWGIIAVLSLWAVLNACDYGPSIYRFYRIGGTEFLLRAIFSGLIAYIGSHNRWDPLIWWAAAFFFPPVALVYLYFYNHLRKTRTMWRRNDLLFVLSCAVYFASSTWIESFGVRFLIYAACICGAITAAIAEDKARNPLPWWVFGTLLFPVALPYAILSMPGDPKLWKKSENKHCPICGDLMPATKKICGFCGHKFE